MPPPGPETPQIRRAQTLLLVTALAAAGLAVSPPSASVIAADTASTAAAIPPAAQAAAPGTTTNNTDTTTNNTDTSSSITLTATNATSTTARLNLRGHYSAFWHYKRHAPTVSGCITSPSPSVTLTNLKPAATYDYRAYPVNGCNASNRLASVSFTTAGIALSASRLIAPKASSAAYTAALATQPTHTVTVTKTGDNPDTNTTFTDIADSADSTHRADIASIVKAGITPRMQPHTVLSR